MLRRNPITMLRLFYQSNMALRYAAKHNAPGLEFARYGQQIGWKLLAQRVGGSWGHLVVPVSITRYFEFPFALSCLPKSPGKFLDVSSPRLFSFYVANKNRAKSIKMINPDTSDAEITARMAAALQLHQINVAYLAIDSLAGSETRFDCIWSISVIEHIAGDYDDTDAIRLMYEALEPGGRLILTVPVDRNHWDEYREHNYYGTQSTQKNDNYFFQRFYDKETIQSRLLDPINKQPSVVRWFGEVTPGRFNSYIERWLREGQNCTVEDPKEIADHYREFASWDEMPGIGVCGLMIEKD